MTDDAQQTVSYPLPVILDRLQGSVDALRLDMAGRFDRIEGQLAMKADRGDVLALASRVTALEVEKAERLKAVEINTEHRQSTTESRRTTIALVVAGLAAAGAIAGDIVMAIGH